MSSPLNEGPSQGSNADLQAQIEQLRTEVERSHKKGLLKWLSNRADRLHRRTVALFIDAAPSDDSWTEQETNSWMGRLAIHAKSRPWLRIAIPFGIVAIFVAWWLVVSSIMGR